MFANIRNWFSSTSPKRRPERNYKDKFTARLAVERLEDRNLMAASVMAGLADRILTVTGTEAADTINISRDSSNVRIGGLSQYFSVTSLDKIQVFGLGGNDRVDLSMGSFSFNIAADLVGGIGNDVLIGGAGNDRIWGESGNDILLGMSGNDQLIGGSGNDHLNGRDGMDKAWGGTGDDVIIAIDNASGDYVQSDEGYDIMWLDGGVAVDTNYGPTSLDNVQLVTSFANGADKTLNGDRISDPTTLTGHTYRRFAANPLFSSSGPALTDVRQGVLGDCYLLAGLGAVAMQNQRAVKQHVVDFNDGTYGVHLGSQFFRVDNDLPVTSSTSTTPAYAKLGAENSMWVAVVEKAFANYRTGAGTYASIANGWSVELNRAFGSTSAGAKDIATYTSSTALGTDVYSRWNNKECVTIGFTGVKKTATGGAPLIMGHMYTVASVVRNSSGVVTSIVLKNPWGFDGAGSDSNTSDGLVTVTPAQIAQYNGQVNWGRV